MEDIRKHHNNLKKLLIQSLTSNGKRQKVLDVGCGHGGDLHKWRHANVELHACDPDQESLEEAQKRAGAIGYRVKFYKGDILQCPPRERYDLICYNFALQYIFESEKLFLKSIECIVNHLHPSGKLFGCIPDSEMMMMFTPFKDHLGNFFQMGPRSGHGGYGEKLFVELVDTLYYQDGPKSEPIAYKDLLINALESRGMSMITWKPLDLKSFGTVTQMYSKFIFVKL